jgi:O-antigen/teichoic acid export membrane protein
MLGTVSLLFSGLGLRALAVWVLIVNTLLWLVQRSIVAGILGRIGLGKGGAELLIFHKAMDASSRSENPYPFNAETSIKVPVGLLAIAWPFGLVNLGAFLVGQIQVPMIASIIGIQAVPAYYAAQRLAQFSSLACMQMILPQLPLFTRELGQNSLQAARRRMIRSVQLVSLTAICIALCYYLTANSIVRFMSHGQHLEPEIIALMAVDLLFMCSSVVWGHYAIAAGNSSLAFINLAAGGANVLLLATFLGSRGIVAVPLASLISGAFTSYAGCWILGWRLLRNLR